MGISESKSSAPPDPEEAFRRFFLALKIAFKTAPIYAADHPAFLKAADDLYDKLEPILAFAPVLTIKFTPRSLFVADRFWDEGRIVLDLARLFHLRKIQSLEIRAGIPRSELRAFAAAITRPRESCTTSG